MLETLLIILLLINITLMSGLGIFVYFIYKTYIKPIKGMRGNLKNNLSEIDEAMRMFDNFKIPNQWNK